MSTAASTCALPPSSLLKFKHQSQMVNSSLSLSRRSASFTLQRISYIRCSSTGNGREKRASPLLQVAVSGATELLRLLFSGKKRVESGISEDSPATQVRCVDDVLRILRSDFDRAYFLTGSASSVSYCLANLEQKVGFRHFEKAKKVMPVPGDFSAELYDEDCIFEDPTIRFRVNVVASLNDHIMKLQKAIIKDEIKEIFRKARLSTHRILICSFLSLIFLLLHWKILKRTYLKFPWRPLIAIRGITIYELDSDFKIIRHAENWNISALEAVGQIFNLTPLVVDE